MIPQYTQMRRVSYEAPQWLIDLGEVVDAEGVEAINDEILIGWVEERWSEEVKG